MGFKTYTTYSEESKNFSIFITDNNVSLHKLSEHYGLRNTIDFDKKLLDQLVEFLNKVKSDLDNAE